MCNLSKQINIATQKGFTLIELVIVIVIVGILAAVAIPNFTSTTDSAKKAANTAILGMVKSAWTAAYAVAKGTPSVLQLKAATLDPVCTGDGPIICGTLSVTVGDLTSPANITCTTAADCM